MFPSSVEWHVPCLIRSLKKKCICTCSQLATQSDESNPNSQGLLSGKHVDFFGDKFTNSLTPCLAIRWKQSCRDRQQIRGFVWGNPQASSFKLKVWAIDGWAPLWACRWNKRESGWVYRESRKSGLYTLSFLKSSYNKVDTTKLFASLKILLHPVEMFDGKLNQQTAPQSLPMIWRETPQQSTHMESPQIVWAFPRGIPAQHRSDYPRPGRKTEPRKPPKVRGQWRVRSTILKQRRRGWHVFVFHMVSNIFNT